MKNSLYDGGSGAITAANFEEDVERILDKAFRKFKPYKRINVVIKQTENPYDKSPFKLPAFFAGTAERKLKKAAQIVLFAELNTRERSVMADNLYGRGRRWMVRQS